MRPAVGWGGSRAHRNTHGGELSLLFSPLLKNFFHCFGHFWPAPVILTLTAPAVARFALSGLLMEMSGYRSVTKSTHLAKAVLGTTESNTAVTSSSNVAGISFID